MTGGLIKGGACYFNLLYSSLIFIVWESTIYQMLIVSNTSSRIFYTNKIYSTTMKGGKRDHTVQPHDWAFIIRVDLAVLNPKSGGGP